MLTPSEDGSADRDGRQMEPRNTASGSGRGDSGNGRQSRDRTANVFTSMIEYRDAYRLQNGLPPEDQHTDKLQSRLTLGTPRPQTYGLPLSNVPRSTGTGPPPRFPSSTQVFTGGTLPGRPSVRTPPPSSSAAGPSISIKRSPKVKIFQKKERTAADMLGTGSGRDTVIHNGLRRVTVENTPQVVYAAGPPTLSPALHRHLPNVSAHLPVSKKPTKKPSPAPASSSSSTPKSTTSSSTMFRSGFAMFHPQSETKPGPPAMLKTATAGTRHVPLPAHSRPTTPVQAGLIPQQTMPIKVMEATTTISDTKDVPLDLSRDTYIPAPMAAVRNPKEVASAAIGAQEGDSTGDCPLDLSVKKRPHSSDSRSVLTEPALKKQAVEVDGVSGKLNFTRPVSHTDTSVNHRSAAAFMGIAFGNPRVAPVGIATATAHAQERQVDVEGPRTPRPAHMHPAQASGLNNHLTDFPIHSDGRAPKDMLMVGRRSPILPGGQCSVRPSLRHSDVVTVRGKPFKVSTVRPQVNGRPVITTRSLSAAVTTAPITLHANMPPSTSNVTVNGTIGSGPLGCLQLSSVAVQNPALTAEAPGKLCELDTIKTPQGPSFVMIGPGTSGLGLRMVSTQQTTSSEVQHSAGAAESSEESESACQTPLLNIPKFKPSKAKTKSKKSSRPPLVINIPDQINTSSRPVHSSLPSVLAAEELKDTQCVSISTQTVNESEESNKDDNGDSDDSDSPIIVDDFPAPDEPVDLKELYPTPSRTLMCARKSTTKQSKRLLQQILESRSPPKLSVITPKSKAPRPDSPSPPPPHMPILSPHRSPPILVPQTLPRVKRESLTSLETVKAEPEGEQGSDCDEEKAATVASVLREGHNAALAVHKTEGDTRLSKKTHTSSSSKKKMYGLKSTPGQPSSISTNTEHSAHPKAAISLLRANSSVSVPSKTVAPNAGCLLAKILVAEGERQLSGRNSPQVSKPATAKSHSAAGSRTPSNVDSDSEATRSQQASRMLPAASSSGGNIFEKFQALATEARVNAEDTETSDELSLMCWEQMAASPPSQKLTSPTDQKAAELDKTKPPKSVEDVKDNVDALSESSEDSTNSVIVKALPKVSNVSAFMPTTKTKLIPLRCASVGDGSTNLAKRSGSPVPIEGTRFYQANCLKGSLSRSTSSPSLETLNTSKPGTPHNVSRSMTNTPQPSPVSLSDDLEDWQIAHVDWQRTKLRRPAGLITIPRSAPKATAMKRLSPEGLYDYLPSIQYGKAKACMTGPSHTPVFTPIRYLSTTTVHGLARLATLDFSNHQPRSARTVAEFNRARSLSEGQRKSIEPPQIETDLDTSETWTTVKEVSPRKPGSPAAARHKESSGTLVTVLRRERSRDDSGSSSKSPIQFQREKSSSFEQPVTFSRPTLNRSESEPIRSHSPASVSSSDSERPKLTVIYSGDGTKVKIAAQTKKKSSKSSKPEKHEKHEKHRRCSYTIKGDQTPPISRDPTSPQPKLSPIRLVASPPRRRKSSKKSESKSPPGSPRLTFVSSLLHVEPSSSSDNQSSDKPTEETKHSLTVVIPKRPKIKMPELKPEPSQNTEKQIPLMKSDSKSPPIAALKIRVDQLPNPPKRMLSPIRINIKSPPQTVEPLPSTSKDVQSERNILYDLPTSPELSADETMFAALVPESPVVTASEMPLKKKEKKASKKHKKDKKRDSSKEKSKLSDQRKEKKEKRNREKDRDKEIVEGSVVDKSSKKKAESEHKKDKSEKKADSENKKEKSEKRADSEHRKDKSEKKAESEHKKEKNEKRAEKNEKRAESEHKKDKSEKKAESENKKDKSEKRAESENKKDKSEKRAESEHRKDKSEKKAESEHRKDKSEKKAESEHKKDKNEKKAESENKKEKSDKKVEVPECAKEESKKKESKEQRKAKTETVDDEKVKVKISKRLKSSHKKKFSEKKKLKLKRKGADHDSEQNKEKREKSDRSERRKGGKKKRSGLKKSKKQLREEKAAEEAKKPKRRSLLDQLTNSDGYVAEKNLDQRKCRDLYADPAKLGREERALLRAMMQFSEMEQSGTDSADYLSVTSDRLQTKKPETSARRKAQALTKCALKRARNRGGCTKKAKFDDFVPEILPSRTRTQAAELSRQKKEPTPTTPEKDEVKGRKRRTSGTDATPSKSSGVGSAKKEKQTIKAPPADDDDDEQWQIMSAEQLQKPVVPVKRKRGLLSRSLTMKIHRKSILWEKYMQNQQRRGRPSKSQKLAQGGRMKGPRQAWSEAAVKEEPVLVAEAGGEGELSQGEDMEAHLQPTLEDVKVKQEPFETEMLTPLMRPDLMRPDPVSAPSPAPSTSTGMSVGGTEEYWPVPECVKKMSVNQNTGETILHKAARLGYEDVARYCAQTDYLDLDARDHAGYTAMHECCSQGHLLVSTLLIEGGASVNLASCDGMRPLHDAVENDLMEMVRLLLSRGADPKLATYSGKTVLGLTKQKEMLSFLTGYVQDLNGCRQPQPEIPWSFHGSAVCEDPEEETGFPALADPIEDDSEGIDGMSFEFSDSPPIQTYFLPLDPVKGAVNYVTLDDVAERLGLTRDVFLKEYTSLPVQTSTPEAILAHCQCLGTNAVERLHELAATGPLKLVEYSDVIRHLLEVDSQRLSDVHPDPELLAAGALPWEKYTAGQCTNTGPESTPSSTPSSRVIESQPADEDCYDWDEQFEQFSGRSGEQVASSSSVVHSAGTQPTTTSADIYRGLFHCGTEDEDEEGEDDLYLAAMGLDDTLENQDHGDNEKKGDQEIFFRKPY